MFREAIELARREAADRWAITLHRSKVRLNVGWVEALTLFPDELRVICRHDLLPLAIRTDDSLKIVYRPGGIYPRWAPESCAVVTPVNHVARFWPHLRTPHAEFQRGAARSPRSPRILAAHSPGVLSYLESFSPANHRKADHR